MPNFKANLKRRSLALNDFDLHVRNLLKSNLHLIDAGEGYRWEENYEFDLGDQADIVFFGPGREAKIVAICTAEEQVSYLKAVQAKLLRHQLCYEQSEEESSEFIQCYLVAKSVNENTIVLTHLKIQKGQFLLLLFLLVIKIFNELFKKISVYAISIQM